MSAAGNIGNVLRGESHTTRNVKQIMPIEKESSNNTPALLLLRERLSKFETEDGRRKGLSYQPRPNDVGICTAAKAGTTWMQQICHQIRAADVGGDMNFDEIGCVVPWIELAVDLGQDLEAEQYGEKRASRACLKLICGTITVPSFQRPLLYFVILSMWQLVFTIFCRVGFLSTVQ